MSVYIVAYGAYCENVSDEPPVLKGLVKDSVGKHVRRVGRFIQLALIGAGRAADALQPNSGVYLTSGRGDTGAMVEVLDTIYREGQSPRPLSFINTVSNAACFYVANTLGLSGASLFIGNRYLSLEMTLKMAMLDMQTQRVDSVLLGVVDMVVAPSTTHRERLGLAPSAAIAEGSHWFQLVAAAQDREILATIEQVQTFPDRAGLSVWLESLDSGDHYLLAVGQSIDCEESSQWEEDTGMQRLDYRKGVGHVDSLAGRALCVFLDECDGTLVYINRDPHGRYVAILLEK